MRPTAVWIIWNLLFVNVLAGLFPENIVRFAVTMWMPALSAFAFLKIEGASLKSGVNWRAGSARSYMVSIAYCIVVATIVVAIGLLTGYLSYNSDYSFGPTSALFTLVIWVVASLGEEIGWRGYLHNHLKSWNHSPLLIGVIWGAWHSRDLLSQDLSVVELGRFTVLTILLSYVLSLLVDIGGSVLTCAVFHGFWNFLRMKLLFGNPSQGTNGLFRSSAPQMTDMEGMFGLVPVIALSIPSLILWYRYRPGETRSELSV